MFLRRIWQGKQSFVNQSYDAEDHIDRINKTVAMIKQQTSYMTRKENYMYEKEESNQQFWMENPFVVRMKEEMERMRMENEELQQRVVEQAENVEKL